MKKRMLSVVVLAALASLVMLPAASATAQTTAEEWFSTGISYEVDGKPEIEKAIESYSKAIELDPEYAAAYYARGMDYYSSGEYDLAIADFTKCIEIKPNSSDNYFNRGKAYRNLNDIENAKKDFRKACDLGNSGGCSEYEKLK